MKGVQGDSEDPTAQGRTLSKLMQVAERIYQSFLS
jgi:hypothetical protein